MSICKSSLIQSNKIRQEIAKLTRSKRTSKKVFIFFYCMMDILLGWGWQGPGPGDDHRPLDGEHGRSIGDRAGAQVVHHSDGWGLAGWG